jgi:hypothetical protein
MTPNGQPVIGQLAWQLAAPTNSEPPSLPLLHFSNTTIPPTTDPDPTTPFNSPCRRPSISYIAMSHKQVVW